MVEILNGGSTFTGAKRDESVGSQSKQEKQIDLFVFPIIHELQLGGLIWWLLQLYSLPKT